MMLTEKEEGSIILCMVALGILAAGIDILNSPGDLVGSLLVVGVSFTGVGMGIIAVINQNHRLHPWRRARE